MKKDLADINDLVSFLAMTSTKLVLEDELWQHFGYNRRPKRGRIWYKLLPKKFRLEKLIANEIFMMGLIDIIIGTQMSSASKETKTLILVGVFDRFILSTAGLVDGSRFMGELFVSYESHKGSDKMNLHQPIISRSKGVLGEKDFAKYVIGIMKLVGTPQYLGSYLLNTEYITEVINDSALENSLTVDISRELADEYAHLVVEKLLN